MRKAILTFAVILAAFTANAQTYTTHWGDGTYTTVSFIGNHDVYVETRREAVKVDGPEERKRNKYEHTLEYAKNVQEFESAHVEYYYGATLTRTYDSAAKLFETEIKEGESIGVRYDRMRKPAVVTLENGVLNVIIVDDNDESTLFGDMVFIRMSYSGPALAVYPY